MGLAASQARLLTITSRKADCEYQSMRLSHQKIALSRELNEISNEYQNSLNQTKLYYDFYGKGDTSNPLNYNLLMTPSALNDYFPTLILNQQGRVVVDSSIAAAARAAGIPQEGINGLPSSDMRNAFVEGLFTSGVISKKTRDSILSTVYNQAAGVGSTDMLSTQYVETDLDGLIDALGSLSVYVNPEIQDCSYIGAASNAADGSKQSEFYLADLLNDQEQYLILTDAQKGARYPASAAKAIANSVSADGGFIDEMYEAFFKETEESLGLFLWENRKIYLDPYRKQKGKAKKVYDYLKSIYEIRDNTIKQESEKLITNCLSFCKSEKTSNSYYCNDGKKDEAIKENIVYRK